MLAGASSWASNNRYKTLSLGRDTVKWSGRLSWQTNLVDWALSTPNLGLEIDLGDPQRIGTPSLLLQFKYRPDQVYMNYWSGRMEWRWHFRHSELPETRKGWMRLMPDSESKQSRIIESYRKRHPELIPGRFYLGAYGDFGSYEGPLSVGLHNHDHNKSGWAAGLGVSAGYEFPGFSYGNRHFLQFQTGLSIGASLSNYDVLDDNDAIVDNHRCVLPVLSEVRFALVYRTLSISRKYWLPDSDFFSLLRQENKETKETLDSIENMLQSEPLTLYVPSLAGDSILQAPVTQKDVEDGMLKLLPEKLSRRTNFRELTENTAFPLNIPGEHYRIGYTLPLASEDYGGDEAEASYILPFRVRITGYDESVERMRSFNDSLRTRYVNRDRVLPAIYLEPVTNDSMQHHASMDDVLTLMTNEWKADSLRKSEVTRLYYREDGEFRPINESQLNRRGTYAMGLKFHPQVSEDFDTLSTRFIILPYISDDDKSGYEAFSRVYSTKSFYVPCTWEYERPPIVSANDVASVISKEMGQTYHPERIELPDSIRYGRNIGTMRFSNAQHPLQFIFVVEDSVSLKRGSLLYEALTANVNSRNATWLTHTEHRQDRYGPIVDSLAYAADSIVAWLNASLEDAEDRFEAKDIHILDPEYSGYHILANDANSQDSLVWTIMQFAYRRLSASGRASTMVGHAAYRIRIDAVQNEKTEIEKE